MGSSSMAFNPNKRLKEQFVSNLTGSSMLEVLALSFLIPALIPLRHSIGFNCKTGSTMGISFKKNAEETRQGAYIASMSVDFICLVLPTILFCTVLTEWTYFNTILLSVFLLFSLLHNRLGHSLYREERGDYLRACLSSYRVSMMVVTSLCILGVDFKIFPRRYAKTEAHGTSLMDLGVGSFVLANSLVLRPARGIWTAQLTSILQSTSPLLVLGFARLFVTSSVDYQVHVGEYGVHWNFFFTLAAVSILTSLVKAPPSYCGILGSLILIGFA